MLTWLYYFVNTETLMLDVDHNYKFTNERTILFSTYQAYASLDVCFR